MTTRSIPRPLNTVDCATSTAEFWLWPSRLSLQAPIVAVLWQLLLASCLRVKLDPFAPWALGFTVWLIYIADHLIDTTRPVKLLQPEVPRKEFCRRHWAKFMAMAVVVAFTLALGVSRFLWANTVRIGWRLALGVAFYFAVIHLTPVRWRQVWPREVVVATLFALGTYVALWSDQLLVPALLFATLCCTNCSVIETWEWQTTDASQEEAPNLMASWIAAHLWVVGFSIAIGAAVLGWKSRALLPFAEAAGLSGLGFVALFRFGGRIPHRFISPLVDLVLCSPFLVLLLSRLEGKL